MKRLNLTGMIALALVWCCGAGASAALIGTDNVRSGIEDVVSIGMMRGWISESGTEFQTNETAPSLSSQPIFSELFAWHKNVDLFNSRNLIVLACRYSLESKTAVLSNLPLMGLYRPSLSRTTVKAIPSGLFVFGIVGWAVRRLRRTGHSFN
ncbi:MAG: hypothetical protein WCH84_05140 [Verrucomicrobiota bacterium]